MKRIVLSMVAVLISNTALANLDLAKQKNCMSCHSVDNKLVGPAYRDVAKRYAGQKDAEDKLVQKVLKGGNGNWGHSLRKDHDAEAYQYGGEVVRWSG